MPAIGRLLDRETSRRTELLDITVSNFLPIVGVVALDWSAAALLLLYWLELGIDAFWALVRALFAGRPPDLDADALLVGPLATRQPTLSIPSTDLRIYLATVVGLPILVPILAGVWLLAGALLVGPVQAPSSAALGSVVLAAVGIFVTTGSTTARSYFLDGAYRKHNARTAFSGLFFRICTVFLGGILTLTFITAATEGPQAEIGSLDPGVAGLPLLLTIVLFKLGSDVLGVYSDRLTVYFRSYDAEYGWLAPPPESSAIEEALPDAPDRLRPSRRGLLLGSPFRLPAHPGSAYLGGLGLLVAGLFALGEAWVVVAPVVAVSVAVPVCLLCLDTLFRYGAVEYRAGPDRGALVAYDRRFDTSLWRIESWDEHGLRIEKTVVDRLLGTETVVIEHDDGEHRLPHLPDASPVVAVFDRAPERPG